MKLSRMRNIYQYSPPRHFIQIHPNKPYPFLPDPQKTEPSKPRRCLPGGRLSRLSLPLCARRCSDVRRGCMHHWYNKPAEIHRGRGLRVGKRYADDPWWHGRGYRETVRERERGACARKPRLALVSLVFRARLNREPNVYGSGVITG